MEKLELQIQGATYQFNASPIGLVSTKLEFKKLGIDSITSYKGGMTTFYVTGGSDILLLTQIAYAMYRGATPSQNKSYLEFTELYDIAFLDENIETFTIHIFGQEFYDNMVAKGNEQAKN